MTDRLSEIKGSHERDAEYWERYPGALPKPQSFIDISWLIAEVERLQRVVQVGTAEWDTAAALVRANDECERLTAEIEQSWKATEP